MEKNKVCITFLGIEGAIATALFLNRHPEAELIISSSIKFTETISSFIDSKDNDIYIIGLGPGNNIKEAVEIIRKISTNNRITWFSHIDHKKIFCDLNNKNIRLVVDESKPLCQTVKENIKNNSSRANTLVADLNDRKKRQHYEDLINKAIYWFFNFGDKDYYPSLIKNLSYESYRPEKTEECYDSYNDQKYLLGKSEKIRRLREMIKLVGMDSFCNVLITGESGTGKTTIAYALHMVSNRKSKPFVSVSCANFSENILESELFGYVKGSFTGATSDKKGIFESANGGTVFLDEIGEMPHHLQSKLLKVLQEKKIRRLGSAESTSVDVRIITATNQDLKMNIGKNTFREDLYYRISTVELRTIPFREQLQDLEYISGFILKNIALKRDKNPPVIPKEAIKKFKSYSWPGNFREFENLLERAFILNDWSFPELPTVIDKENKTPDQLEIIPLKEYELKYIVRSYKALGENKTKTAETLGISLNTLKKHLKNAGVK